jgi:hypothetical protein
MTTDIATTHDPTGVPRRRSGNARRRLAALAAAIAASTGLVAFSATPAQALSVDVRVTILQVDALDSFEEPGDADFYAVTTIDGTERSSDQCQFEDDDHIAPGWEFKKENVDLSKGSVPVTIEIWDDDDPCDELFSLRGDDDQGDITPTGDRTLSFNVQLGPCTISGGVTGSCKTNIQSAGTSDDDNASIVFQVAVDEPPSAPGMNIRCLHTPLWPQPGDTVTIRAEYLDGNLQPDLKIADQIQVFLGNDRTTPAGSVSGADEFTFTTPAVGAPSFSYACRLVDDGTPIWPGWRTVNVGPPPVPGGAVPVMFTGPMASRIDVVLIPDKDDYTGPGDPAFQNDMRTLLDQAYFAQGDNTANASLLLTNQDTFNFWLAGSSGDARGVVSGKCQKDPPATWDSLHSFADVGAIIHTADFRDCASGNTFSSEQDDFQVFRHEQGHRPFGLADEYCKKRPGSMSSVCDGGYFQADPFPNVYEDGGDCEGDLAALGRAGGSCQRFQADSGDQDFWETSEPVSGDLMVDNTTPQAADVRRIDWMLNTQCASGNC